MKKDIRTPILHFGVYYDAKSYAGLWTRSCAWMIDLLFLSLLVGLYSHIYIHFSSTTYLEQNILVFASFFTCFFYLTVIKNTSFSTLGFWFNKLKIVDLYGEKPHFLKMTLRFLLLSICPFELITDILWLTSEDTKQTLRDKYAGTYVVTKEAEPVGSAIIIQTRLHVLGANLLLNEVDPTSRSSLM